MSRITRVLLLALLLVAAGSVQQAIAAPLLVGKGAFVSPTIVNFAGIPDEALITNQFAGAGVTFSGALYGLTNSGDTSKFPGNGGGVIASNWIYYGGGMMGLSFTADFGSIRQRVGFYLENWPVQLATIELFNGATSLGSVTYTTASLYAEFVGVEDLSGFDRMVFTNTATRNGFYAIDDFQFEGEGQGPEPIPEPASLLLFGSGLVGLRAWKKRRQ